MHKAASIGKGPISSSAAEVILPMAGGDVCIELKAVSITRGLVCQFDVVFKKGSGHAAYLVSLS